MMKALAAAALCLVLTGCTSMPVGTVALCVGVCRYKITSPPPQSAAEKAGALAGGLIASYLSKGTGHGSGQRQ